MEYFSPTQRLARDRRGRLEAHARHYRQARELPIARRGPLRTGAGWVLVRAGLRLAHVDPFPPAPARALRG